MGLEKCYSLHSNMGVFQHEFVKVLHYWRMANCKRERMYWWWAATSGFYHHFLCQRPSLQGRRAIGVKNPKFLKFTKYQNKTKNFVEVAMERYTYTVRHFLPCMFSLPVYTLNLQSHDFSKENNLLCLWVWGETKSIIYL